MSTITEQPRSVTPEAVAAAIASEHYFTAFDGATNEGALAKWNDGSHVSRSLEALGLLTFCVLVLKNGFTVVGKSACVSPEKYNATMGRQIAREKAVQEIWELLAYELKTQLSGH